MYFLNSIKCKFFSFKYKKFFVFYITHIALKQINILCFKNFVLCINIKQSGCAGFVYFLEKKKNIGSDIFYKNEYIKLFISNNVLPFLNFIKLDYVKNGLNFFFKFYNLKAKYTCSCGDSFDFNEIC